MSPVDALAQAHKLEQLRDEAMTISARLQQIRVEVQEIFAALDAKFIPQPNRRTPTRPRPLDDKLAISAGRTIVAGIKGGWDKDRTKAEVVRKAKALAVRYGTAGLSAEFETKVDRSVEAAFQRGGVNAALRA